jgi:hypothetical protein
MDLSDRALKNYEGRGKLLNAVPNLGSDPHQGAKLAQFHAHYQIQSPWPSQKWARPLAGRTTVHDPAPESEGEIAA